MKTLFSNFALVDVGASKVALVVPRLDAKLGARMGNSKNTAPSSITARACIVEPVRVRAEKSAEKSAEKLTKKQQEKIAPSSEIARAEAFRRARLRAETMLRTRLRKVFLLANEPSLTIISPSQEQSYKNDNRDSRREDDRQNHHQDHEDTIVINVAATDRNKRPLSFYAMDKRSWQFYTRLASYAGVSIVGFVSPAVALGQSLLVHRRALVESAQHSKGVTKAEVASEQSFIVIDIGSHTTGVAVFAAGVPYACQSWQFGTLSITTALAKAFALTLSRAATLQRNLVFSNAFLNSLLASSAQADEDVLEDVLSERRFPRADAFAKKTSQPAPLGTTTQSMGAAASQQGTARIVASAYGALFAEVARFLKRCAPRLADDAPVYTTGGGSLKVGSQVLASHLLARCVLPYPCLGARIPASIPASSSSSVSLPAFSERIAATSALACLSVLARGEFSPLTLSSMSPRSAWARRLRIFSSREDSRDSFPPQQEETSHA